MKLWLAASLVLLILSGCSSRLQNQSVQQANTIEKQKQMIEYLHKKIDWLKAQNQIQSHKLNKNIKLKKVEDNNFNSDHMYPQAKAKQAARVTKPQTSLAVMGKDECISLVGQAKFDKYTKIFGSEASSIKRCAMLKSMTN